MRNLVLGISAYYHDSAAAIIENGNIIAAAHEERFTRKKQDKSFPVEATKYVMSEAGCEVEDLSLIVFYDKPFLKFERLLETYYAFAPRGFKSFLTAIPVWLDEKLFMKRNIWEGLQKASCGKINKRPKLIFSEHHFSHAASAFYPSPFEEAAILTIDGVGEWSTATISCGEGSGVKLLRELRFPHSIGLLYSAFTYYCGFKVNSGEYKLMGLAPYGIAKSEEVERFKKCIRDNLVHIFDDGSIQLHMKYFNFATGLTMCNDKAWAGIFGIPKRSMESEVSQPYMNMALAIQEIINEIMVRIARTAKKISGKKNLVMAGGVALNCVANSSLLKEKIFENIWIQPAAGDAGGALGAAYMGWFVYLKQQRVVDANTQDSMQGSYLGPQFSEEEIAKTCLTYQAKSQSFSDFSDLCSRSAQIIAEGNVVGWFQGRMEWGPRALGNRSIIGDARNPEMQKKLNLQIKYREGFRPFAPAVLEEDVEEYFELETKSPYMLLVAPVKKSRCMEKSEDYDSLPLYERLYSLRSDIPAVTHVDYSARVQSVSKATNPKYWQLIDAFKRHTGYGLLINTSFNVRGEPIVCTPSDAYKCFMRTEMDYLVMGNRLFAKTDQCADIKGLDGKTEFALD